MLRAVAVAVVSLAGCGDEITLEIASDRPVPTAIDAICVGIADQSLSGGHFGKLYRLEGKLGSLPQTLRVESGEAESARAWVRADRGGVSTMVASQRIDFGGDVTVTLPKCQIGGPAPVTALGAPAGPTNAMLVGSHGHGGTLVLAISAGAVAILDTSESGLVPGVAPAAPTGTPVSVIAIDIDGDCDDDAIIATDGAAPVIWERDGAQFFAGASIGSATVRTVGAADIEHDGDIDLIFGSGGTLELWRNDGAGSFSAAPGLAGAGRVSSISALVLGDIDGDGFADLVVGQDGPPLVAWLGTGGTFEAVEGVLPAIPLNVDRLTLADADGDFDPDLAIAIAGLPMRLLVNRDGRLEDQSFVRLPQPAPTVRAIAFGGWDPGCEPDAVIASDLGAPTLKGLPGGAFEAEPTAAPAATDVTMIDIDDDGDLDAILATPQGVQWLAR